MPPKKHHYIPQMHLRLFSVGGKEKQLYAFDKETRNSYLVAIEDAAAQSGYYTFESEAGEASLEFEALLAKIEGFAQRAIGRLRALQPPPLGGTLTLSRGDRDWLAGYIALQHLRVPAQRERMQGMWNLLGTFQADMALRNPEEFLKRQMTAGRSRQEAERMRQRGLAQLQAGSMKVTSDPIVSLHLIQQGVGPVSDRVARMSWLVLKQFEPPCFLISDNPVQLWPPENHPPVVGIGFATPGVQVSLPIDPMTLLIGINEPLPEKVSRVRNAELVLEFNRKLWREASRFVYGPSQEALEATRAILNEGDESYRRPTVEVASPESHGDWLPYIERAKDRPVGRRKRARRIDQPRDRGQQPR